MAVAGEAVTGELTATNSDSDVGGTEDSCSSVSTVSHAQQTESTETPI